MVIKRQIAVSIGGLRVLPTENPLLQDDALCLELNRLKEVTELELDAGKLCNAGSDLFVHGPRNL